MCSSVNRLMKLHLARSQSSNLTLSNEDDDLVEWCFTIAFLARVVTYIAVLALIMIVIFMVMKYLEELDEERSTGEEGAAAETNRLWPGKTVRFTYGTCEEDLESGACSTGTSFSSSSGSGNSSNASSPEGLYDKKLCVICYDEQRNCFFVPCGHCATCYICAQRIFNGENKTCPVCRRFIGRVRKLLAP